jgi:hypothetical protein
MSMVMSLMILYHFSMKKQRQSQLQIKTSICKEKTYSRRVASYLNCCASCYEVAKTKQRLT